MKKFIIISCLLVLAMILACTRGVDKEKILNQGPFIRPYETVWVNPQLVYSDSLITLIKAERLDSILVDNPMTAESDDISTVSFHVNLGTCLTTLELRYSSMKKMEIFKNDLSRGYYKVTVNTDRLELEQSKQLPALPLAAPVYLEASYCGNFLVNKILE